MDSKMNEGRLDLLEAQVAALTGMVIALTEILPPKQRQAALQRIHLVLENTTAALLAQPGAESTAHIAAIDNLRAAIFKE